MSLFDSIRYPITDNPVRGVTSVPQGMLDKFRNHYRNQPETPGAEWSMDDTLQRIKFLRKIILEWEEPT